jgi:heat shock protein HslJ
MLNGEAIASDSAVRLNFGDDGQLAGIDGCNQYSAPYNEFCDRGQFSL